VAAAPRSRRAAAQTRGRPAGALLVAQDARHLAGHLTWRGLGEFAVVFTLVWIAWTNGSLHHELHGHDDARGRSTFLLQILVLPTSASSTSSSSLSRSPRRPALQQASLRRRPADERAAA
jgi:hypothetical protein